MDREKFEKEYQEALKEFEKFTPDELGELSKEEYIVFFNGYKYDHYFNYDEDTKTNLFNKLIRSSEDE